MNSIVFLICSVSGITLQLWFLCGSRSRELLVLAANSFFRQKCPRIFLFDFIIIFRKTNTQRYIILISAKFLMYVLFCFFTLWRKKTLQSFYHMHLQIGFFLSLLFFHQLCKYLKKPGKEQNIVAVRRGNSGNIGLIPSHIFSGRVCTKWAHFREDWRFQICYPLIMIYILLDSPFHLKSFAPHEKLMLMSGELLRIDWYSAERTATDDEGL